MIDAATGSCVCCADSLWHDTQKKARERGGLQGASEAVGLAYLKIDDR